MTMYNFKKRLIRASTPASDVHERLKTNGKAMKIARDNQQIKDQKYNSEEHLRRQQVSFTKTSI